MRILNMLAIIATAYFTTGCDDGKTKVSGNVTADVTELEVYSIDPTGMEPIDTIEVKDGKFDQVLNLDTADFILIKITDQYQVPLFVKPGEKVKLELTGTDEDPDYTVTGSPESERIWRITDIRNSAFDKIDSLNTASQEAQNTPMYEMKKAELDSLFQKVVKNTSQAYKDMIDEEPGSIANIFIFSQSIGNYPLITPQEDFAYFERVDSAIGATYGDLKHVTSFHKSIASMKQNLAMQEQMNAVKNNLKPGSEIPEISLEGPNGTVRKLSDLRGKVVLVDFWAAWCRPCRAQNPFLVKLYNDYKAQGFDVYSVSLDGLPQQQNPKEEWLGAIEQDGLTWENHVSDLKGWETQVVGDFGFNGIPFTVLVDREGKIIATELRGPELEEAVKAAVGS